MAKIYQNRGGTLTPILDTDKFVNTDNVNQTIQGTKTFSGSINVPNQTVGDYSQKAANTKFVQDTVTNLISCREETYTAPSGGVPENTNITIPSSQKYIVGSNMLEVYYNGLIEYRGDQYDEVGTANTESGTITIKHAMEEGDKLVFRINGLCDADSVSDAVHITGTETITGTKTFSVSPNVPTVTDVTDSSTKIASTKFVHDLVDGYANCQDEVLDITTSVSSGSNVTLPSGMQYVVGTNQLMVSYNGTVCHVGEQFNEVGTNGSISTQIQILFDLRVGDQVGFRINGFGNTTDIPSLVHRSGNESIDGVKSFGSSPIVPSPSLGDYSNNVVTSKWVKDISTAAVYVSPSGDDSNSGMTAAESVRTIGRGIEILKEKPTENHSIYLSGGAYSENIHLDDTSITCILLGNVSLNGYIFVENKSKIHVIDEGNDYTLSISTSTYSHCIEINRSSTGVFDCKVNASLNYSTGDALFSYGYSVLWFTKFVTVTTMGSIGSCALTSNSLLRFDGGFTNIVSSGSLNHVMEAIHNSVMWIVGDLSESKKTYTLNGMSSTLTSTYNSFITIGGNIDVNIVGTRECLLCYRNSSMVFNTNGTITTTLNSARRFVNCSALSAVLFEGSANMIINGSVSDATFACQLGSCIDLSSNYTVSGNLTGRRYNVTRSGIINTSGGGANRVPGSTAGNVETSTYALYL